MVYTYQTAMSRDCSLEDTRLRRVAAAYKWDRIDAK